MVSRGPHAEQVEQALLAELDRVERRIAKLNSEKAALKSIIAAHRIEKLDRKETIRRNSFTKLVVQKKIVDALRGNAKPVSSIVLYNLVIRGYEDKPMNKTTFRSYLYRMTEDGYIERAKMRGYYTLK